MNKFSAAYNSFLLPFLIQGSAPMNWQMNKQANLPVPITLFSRKFCL